MRKVYFDLGVSTICITCHAHPREDEDEDGGAKGGAAGSIVSINKYQRAN